MTQTSSGLDRPGIEGSKDAGGVREVARLAWPAVLSYILNNTYRINDQFWIQGLGENAQAAIGATFFVLVFNFAAMFLAVGGTLALVARATGAQDPTRRASIMRHAILFGIGIGVTIAVVSTPFLEEIVHTLGLRGEAAVHAQDYLGTLYLFLPAMALFPVVDSIFIGLGRTRIPMCLQIAAVALNYVLNPILIYGASAADHINAPGVELFSSIAASLGIEGHGIAGAAYATGIARVVTSMSGLLLLFLFFGLRFGKPRWPQFQRFRDIAAIGAPVSVSIAVYSATYALILSLVVKHLGQDVTAGLGLGFQVFEGVAFPTYLGVAIAGSTLVGRAIGARDPDAAWRAVRSARLLARCFGIAFAILFFFGGPLVIDTFTSDPDVRAQTLLYVSILAFSQYWVAVEAVNEKVLLGAGQTRSILWISPVGNLARVPISWVLALSLGWGAAGVWWAINLTTGFKAFFFWSRVQSSTWLDDALAER